MPANAASVASKEAASRTERRPWLPHWLTSEHPFPWLLPAGALMVVFGIYPLVYAVALSFYKKNAATRKMVLDFDHNWTKVLYDERVWNALFNTFVYTGIALVFQLVLGMLIALLLDSDRKGYALLRGMMTLPLVIPPAVTAMMFLLMLNGSFGVLSRSLIAMGLLPVGFSILGNASTAMAGVLLAEIWQWTPFMVLIMLAGLRSLPKEPFEAAAIDGANAVQMFTRLTLPMMSRVIAIAVLIRGIDIFRMVDYIHVMTARGPGTATLTLPTYATQEAFTKGVFNYASTIALVTLILIIITSTLFMKIFRVRL
jgi:multiple sugar transport system permease protein